MQLGDQDDLFLVSCSPSFDIHYSPWVVSSRPIVTVGFVSQPSVSYTTTHDASSRLRTVDSPPYAPAKQSGMTSTLPYSSFDDR